jgi:AraC-like DNA-binding protein
VTDPDTDLAAAQRAELVRAVAKRALADGETKTPVPFASLLRYPQPSATRQGVIEPSLCVVVQGTKELQLAGQTYRYGAFSYVMSAIEFPTAGRITGATRAKPYLALRIALDPAAIAQVLVDANLEALAAAAVTSTASPARPAIFVGHSDAPLVGCFLRILQLANEPAHAEFLAAAALRELIYRLLRGEHGAAIARVARPANVGIGRAIDYLRRHFDRPIDIAALAKSSRMSVSSLRHEFKATTALAPLQYQKQLRLQEARRLMLSGELDAGGAAFRVGYESPSQFSREYRRLFGTPPMRHVRGRATANLDQGITS